jgi:predicted alpha/beta-hydrolase family hydrolase
LNAESFAFDVGGAPSSAMVYRAPLSRRAIVLAHGAGGRQRQPWMMAMARALASRGSDVVTFDFLYAHAGKRLPDRTPVLEQTWRAVLAAVRSRGDVSHETLFVGGKSMGGRIATHVAADRSGEPLTGVILFGYPLHPPGKPQTLRAEHLPRVRVPMLFVQGSRDAFGRPDELSPVVEPLSARLFVVEGGDHSLTPTARSGETVQTVIERVADEVTKFVSSLTR